MLLDREKMCIDLDKGHKRNRLAGTKSTLRLLTIKAQHDCVQLGLCSGLEMFCRFFFCCCWWWWGDNGYHVMAFTGIG